jgi:hypothetical protein
MKGLANGLSVSLAVLLAGLGTGCETVKENGLTANLWQKDPCASVEKQAQGHDYIYSPLARTTLTPLTVVGDATIIGVAIGAGCVVAGCGAVFADGAEHGGKLTR